jgi:predicted chitinase
MSKEQNIRLLIKTANDAGITIPQQIAYLLATVQHETDGKYEPIEEYASGSAYEPPSRLATLLGNIHPGDGKLFKGRGFCQITGRANYARFSLILSRHFNKKIDLITNPELTKDPVYAAYIIAYGMKNGSFTGKRLGHYISETKADYRNARRIINGLDKADLIAGYAKKWESMLVNYDGK